MDPVSLILGVFAGAVVTFLITRALARPEGTLQAVLEERLQQQQTRNEEFTSALEKEKKEHETLRSRFGELEKELAALEARQDLLLKKGELLSDKENELTQGRKENTSLREQLSSVTATLHQERQHGKQRLEDLNQVHEAMATRFKVLADEVLETKGKVLSDRNQEQLKNILTPLREQLGAFKTKVEETYDKEARERHSLVREIQNLQSLNERLSTDALNLTNALKGQTKAQGNWGEIILERVLEMSGLENGREFVTQQAFHDRASGSRYIPDVVVFLPDQRHLVVDSKVSLVAYERYCSAPDQEREKHMKDHVLSLREHIRQLSDKPYSHLEELNTVDFVFLFVPIEAAFTEAMRFSPELFNEAMAKNIVLVTPSTLLATLRTVENIWRFDKQNRHAVKIAEDAGRLYDKFANFVLDLKDVGQRLDQARTSYDGAFNKLSQGKGNLVSRVEKLRLLGAKASKQLDPGLVESSETPELEAGGDTDESQKPPAN